MKTVFFVGKQSYGEDKCILRDKIVVLYIYILMKLNAKFC